jgi:hypothetical protein
VSFSRVRSVATLVVLATVGIVLVADASAPLHNTDTYFHLRFGHEFLSGDWSLRDPGSVSSLATADWVPTQWLSEVVMAQTEDWFGLAGVAWLSGLLVLSLAVAVYWACRRQAEPFVAALLVMLTMIACTSGISMRPQLVSYLLVVVTTAAWQRARDTGRAPWLLVPVTWVWTLCHGMWPVGIVIGVVAVLGLALDRGHPRRTLGTMAAVPVLSAAVSLLSPAGPGLFPAVLRVGSRAEYFYEWDPPDYTKPWVAMLAVILALAVLPGLRRAERVPWFDVLLVGLAALFAVFSMRTVPVAACLAAPLAAAALQPAIGARPPVLRRERLLVAGGAVLALATLAVLVPHTADEPRATPSWLDGALGDLPAGTRVLNDSGFGAYLMWRFPQLDVVVHGYGDLYTDDELERNADIEGVRAGWVELVQDTGAAYAVLPPGSPLAYGLRAVEGWTVVEHSADLELLRPPPGWLDEG